MMEPPLEMSTVSPLAHPTPARPLALAAVIAAALVAGSPARAQASAPAPALATQLVSAGPAAAAAGYDGTVEAVRQTVLAAQVAGAVVALHVRAGDRVKAGQLLVRLDARAAEQQAGAAAAQVLAARAAQEAATSELQRQRQLHQQNYISLAALERAEAQHKTAAAQAEAQLAAAQAARTESGWYVVRAPYDGIVADVPVVQGDLAMPGRALLTLYDPAALRVSATVPETAAQRLRASPSERPAVELPGVAERLAPTRVDVLPAVDPATHTVTVRLDLPAGTAAAPGAFARVWLSAGAATGEPARAWVPARSLVLRGELKAVYVVAGDGRPLLRQVRVGPARGDQVEILAGVAAGERVALDPQAAARVR